MALKPPFFYLKARIDASFSRLSQQSSFYLMYYFFHFYFCCSPLVVLTIAPALLDSSFHQPPTSWPRSPNPPPRSDLPGRLIGHHFLGKRESDSSCEVCSRRRRRRRRPEEEAEQKKRKTICDPERKKDEKDSVSEELTDEESETDCGTRQTYYCKTCSEEPGLCPVPCFELYHTLLVYKTAPRLEAQGQLLF